MTALVVLATSWVTFAVGWLTGVEQFRWRKWTDVLSSLPVIAVWCPLGPCIVVVQHFRKLNLQHW